MKLSIIIVSYNVRNFLENCLISVRKSALGIESEIFVVDNHSTDQSADMVAEKFPEVNLIRNNTNPGFSKANNQALHCAKGEYILFLNPDTLVEENTFNKCIDFMDSRPLAGAMGVKMIDGKGKYLPESKRSVPTPLVALYKISGLTALFPRSRHFGKYYLGHLNNDFTNEIEVLTGAFFFVRKKALDKTGWFDEDFFMYGEDIDLSLRILKENYTILYYPGTAIIHYKGESTRKSTINYVLTFYRAMIIYAKKHFNTPGTYLLLLLLYFAIWFSAGLSIAKRLTSRISLPAIDAGVISLGYIMIPSKWEEQLIKSGQEYPEESQAVMIPALIIVWIVSIYRSGGYHAPIRVSPTFRGVIYGSLIILIIYAMLNSQWYAKLATIIPLAIWTAMMTAITRVLLIFSGRRKNNHHRTSPSSGSP